MENRIKKRRYIILLLLTFMSIFSLLIVENSKINVRKEWYREKVEAVTKTFSAFKALKELRFKNAVFLDEINDPDRTTLIGQEFTLITTKYGDLDAKLLSINPNFSALIVDYLKGVGLKKGDKIAIGLTGSFPGLNISAIIAAETLGVEPVIITSVGSSSWGANDPYFTWLDIEKFLFNAKFIKHHSIAASIGGGDDIGMGLSPEGRDLIKKSITRNGIRLLMGNSLEDLIKERLQLFSSKSTTSSIKAYINIGGGMASLGTSSDAKIYHSGIIRTVPVNNFSVIGVVNNMLSKNIPVINLHNIGILANKSGIFTGKFEISKVGTGRLFTELRYDVTLTSIFTIILILSITLFFISERRDIIKNLEVKK